MDSDRVFNSVLHFTKTWSLSFWHPALNWGTRKKCHKYQNIVKNCPNAGARSIDLLSRPLVGSAIAGSHGLKLSAALFSCGGEVQHLDLLPSSSSSSMPPSAALSSPSSSFHREAAEMQQLNPRKNSFQEFLGPLVPAWPPVRPIRKSFLVFLCLLCPTTKSLSSHVSAGQAPRTWTKQWGMWRQTLAFRSLFFKTFLHDFPHRFSPSLKHSSN